jgi:hypothetical protein
VERYERAICLLADTRPFLTSPNMAPPLRSKMAAKQYIMFFLATIRQAAKSCKKIWSRAFVLVFDRM